MASAPPPKKGGAGKIIGIGCLVLVLLSCLCGGGWFGYGWYKARQLSSQFQNEMQQAADQAAQQMQQQANDQLQAGDPAAAAGGGSGCGRAKACCEAYADAMAGSAMGAASADQIRSTCSSYDNPAMPASSCDQVVAGYVTGLNALNIAVPSACK